MPNDNIVYVFHCNGIRSWRFCGQALPSGSCPEAVITRYPWRASIHDYPREILPSDPCERGTFADAAGWPRRSLRQYCGDLRRFFDEVSREKADGFARVPEPCSTDD